RREKLRRPPVDRRPALEAKIQLVVPERVRDLLLPETDLDLARPVAGGVQARACDREDLGAGVPGHVDGTEAPEPTNAERRGDGVEDVHRGGAVERAVDR